jgi:hypothetical protein
MPDLQKETNRSGRKRWLRIAELPFSRQHFYNYFRKNPEVVTVTIKMPGSNKGIILIDSDSLDRYLEKLAVQQIGAEKIKAQTVTEVEK